MGASHKNSESDNYQLKKTLPNELGKTFVYDRIKDNIDLISQSNETPIRAKNADFSRINLLSRTVTIIIASVPALISVLISADFRQKLPQSVAPAPASLPPAIEPHPIELTKDSKRNIGILKTSRIFIRDRLTPQDPKIIYFFTIDKPSNVSLYLDNVTNEVGMWLYVDTNGNGVLDSEEKIDSASADRHSFGIIEEILGPNNYILVVQKKGGNTNYTVTMTSQ